MPPKMINRALVPDTIIPSVLPKISFATHVLPNGVQLYESKVNEELVRISFYFKCGSLYSSKKGVVSALSKLLFSGTSTKNAYTIQEELDFYGAYADIDTGYEHVSLTLFCVNHLVDKTLRFLVDVLHDIQIPEEEFNLYKSKNIEKLKVNQQKTSFHARRLFMQSLYGSEHPYGRSMEAQDYENLNLSDVQSYYNESFVGSLDHIITNTPLPKELHAILGKFCRHTTKSVFHVSSIKESEKIIQHPFDDAVQASLFLGMPCLTRHDADYPAWSLLITLFGGYFGSRLMKNIREDKGYTYGIGAGTHHLPDRAYLSIRSDVKNEVKEECVEEIYKEIARLKEEMISEHELNTVKNYMLGAVQRSFDGSLSLCDRFKTLIDHNLDLDYYHSYTQSTLTLRAEDLQKTAINYLDTNKLHVISVGTFAK